MDDADISRLLSGQKKDKSLLLIILKPIVFLVLPMMVAMSFIPGPTGKPILDWKSFIPTAETFGFLKPVFDKLPYEMNPLTTDVRVYRWQDKNGQWHFSEQAPVAANAEEMLIDTEANIVGSTYIPEIEIEAGSAEKAGSAQAQLSDSLKNLEGGQTSMNPMKVLQDAKAVKALAEQRNKVLDQL